MSEAMFAVQDAVLEVLAASSAVQEHLGSPARIFDHVPPEATFPFLTLGEAVAVPFDTKDRSGMSQTITLHVWSRYRGRKQVKDVLKAVYDTLHQGTLSVAGQDFVDCRFEAAETMLDDDGLTYHGVARYRVRTQGG